MVELNELNIIENDFKEIYNIEETKTEQEIKQNTKEEIYNIEETKTEQEIKQNTKEEVNNIEETKKESKQKTKKEVNNIEESKQETKEETRKEIKSVKDCEILAKGDNKKQLKLTWKLLSKNNDWNTFKQLLPKELSSKLLMMGLLHEYTIIRGDNFDKRDLSKEAETINKLLDFARRFETVGLIRPSKDVVLKTIKAYVDQNNEDDNINHAINLMGLGDNKEVSITSLKANKDLLESILLYFNKSSEYDELFLEIEKLDKLTSKVKGFEDFQDFETLEKSNEWDDVLYRFNKRDKKESPCEDLETKKDYILSILDRLTSPKKEELNKLKVDYTSATQKRIVEFIKRFTTDMLYASSFENKKVFTKYIKTPEGVEKNVSSNDLTSFVELYVKIDPKTKSTVLDIIRLILDLYPIGERGGFLKTLDKSTKSPIIDKFAKFIDDQAGRGAFAAYMLYPMLFNNPEIYNTGFKFGIKRQFVAGIRPSTGKSILGKLLSLTYKNSLVFKIGPRQETSQSGYNAAKHNWNSSIINEKIIFIDDDNGDNKVRNASRADFWKNLYSKNALTIGSRGAERTATFNGFAYSNTNYYGDDFTAEEVAKRVYILHLIELVNDHFDKDEVALLHKTDNPELNIIPRDALINYLNDNIENAIDWFNTYTTPKEATQAELIKGTEEYDLISYILGMFKIIKEQNPNSKVIGLPLSFVKSYVGGYVNGVKVTPTLIDKITQGRMVVQKTRFIELNQRDQQGNRRYKVGSADGSLQQCVRFALGIDFNDFEEFGINTDEVEDVESDEFGIFSKYGDIDINLCSKVNDILKYIASVSEDANKKSTLLATVNNMLNDNMEASLLSAPKVEAFDEDVVEYEAFDHETF